MEINEMLKRINDFTRRDLTEEEVYIFDVVLCDNEIDRDNERFSLAALKTLEKLFIGKTGIFDHDAKSGGQTARIFATELVTDDSAKTAAGEAYTYLKAMAYMVRTEQNAGLIREIDGGIKKEVSVSCSAKTRMCSVCGTDLNKKKCSHKPGKIYNGKTAHVILDNITDAYEWSFVAVPAQVNAGVTKRFGGAESSEDSSELLEKLCENLKADVYRLCMAGGNCAYAGILKSAADKMSAAELLEFKNVLEKEHRSKAVSQLGMAENSYKEFRMEGVLK